MCALQDNCAQKRKTDQPAGWQGGVDDKYDLISSK
jgi:hypothetical protein